MQPEHSRRNRDALLSIVVPVFNEAGQIAAFLARVRPALAAIGCAYEIIFVDDGSSDATFEVIRRAGSEDLPLRCIGFSRNFGKEAAITAGLSAAIGDAVVVIDVDLQDPPELIGDFVAKWQEGWDVVYGARANRTGDPAAKRLTAGWFYSVFNRIAETKLPIDAGDFRLMDRRVVQAVLSLPERSRFMKGIFAWVGFRTTAIPYSRPERSSGTTKYRPLKLLRLGLDGIFAFSVAPLRLALVLGATLFVLSSAYLLVILGRTLVLGIAVPGYASLLCVTLFLGGTNMLLLGIFGEYLGRLMLESKRRPLYIIDRLLDRPAEVAASLPRPTPRQTALPDPVAGE